MRSEFEFIENIKKKYSLNKIGDDCAVLPKDDKTDMVITADLFVEDIDFRLEWTTPEFLGHKALAVSVSDIAAMGAQPVWAMLSIGVPENLWKTEFIDRFYEGWHCLANEFGVELIGGDVSKSPETLVIDSVAGGEVPRGKAILRAGAKVGDAIFVSGKLGGAAGGLRLLENGSRYAEARPDSEKNLIRRQLQPIPKVELGKILQSNDIATSMIDLSDGFSSDLAHIASENGLGARIATLPVDSDLYEHFSNEEAIQMAFHGGEDFELLFTVSPEKISALEKLPVTHIGEITSNAGMIELIRDGKTEILEPKGYRHF